MRYAFKTPVGDVYVFGLGSPCEAWLVAIDEVDRRYRVLEAMSTENAALTDEAIHLCKQLIHKRQAELYKDAPRIGLKPAIDWAETII